METIGRSGFDKDADGALVAASKRGDTQAFEKLILRYERRALAVALRITNNLEDAEDVVQEGLHKAYLHLNGFQEKSGFSTWLTRIIMNEAYMLLRRRRRLLEVFPNGPDDDLKSASEAFLDEKPSPEESCWQRERSELLTRAINRLGPTIRTTMLLRHIDDRSTEETARILGTSIGAVKARLFHGRRKLRETVNRGLLHAVVAAGQIETHC